MNVSFLKTCQETCKYLYDKDSSEPFYKRILLDSFLREQAKKVKMGLFQVFALQGPGGERQGAPRSIAGPSETGRETPGDAEATGPGPLKAICWNLERGKNFEAILQTFKTSSSFQNVDLFFLTEVDWGMARSGNRNITAELGKALGYYAYFAPSYFNLTQGHGSERYIEGQNQYGLHGKAILSRYPLQNLKSVGMPNAINKLKSKEARLGEKRALLGDLNLASEKLTLACAHLDAFSSPKMRRLQLSEVVKACVFESRVLMAGDWNTNSINSTSGATLLKSMIRQILLPGPKKMIQGHFPYPYRKFDKPLFEMLSRNGFDYESLNEMGVGTFDLFENDQEMGMMVSDQYPRWLIKKVNEVIVRSGGLVSLKLDWFAGKNIQAKSKRVLKLQKGKDFSYSDRPSDHHPIYLEFVI